jgi:hypothetical protein
VFPVTIKGIPKLILFGIGEGTKAGAPVLVFSLDKKIEES